MALSVKVFVTLKAGVLDPQGKAVHNSIETLGFTGIDDIRQGKYFEISFAEGTPESEAREAAEKIAKDVLANPVIEDFRVEIV
jgi:phosphoribosylformylglycinamidine synthase